MTLDKFEYVLAVAEEKNLTKAAKRLYISQPGLTSYINKLEQYLGIKLFDRSTSPIRVTEAGRCTSPECRRSRKRRPCSVLRSRTWDLPDGFSASAWAQPGEPTDFLCSYPPSRPSIQMF